MPIVPVDTAVQIIMGPLIDDGDFKTRETSVAHNATGMDMALIKSSITGVPTFTALTPTTGSTQDWVNLGDGWYYIEITAAQNDTEGELVISGFATGVLPWRSVQYQVVPQTVYNSLVAGSDTLPVDQIQLLGTAVATPTVAGVQEVDITHISGSAVNTASAQIGTNVVSTATGAITATSIAADAIGASELASDAVTEIANAVWDMDATGHQTTGTFGQAIGDPVADTNSIYKAVVTDATGATVGVDVVAVKAETASIQSDTNDIQTRLPAALVSGRIDASIGAAAANTITASALATDAIAEISDGVWDEDATGHQTQGTFGQAIGDPVADTNTIYQAVVTDAAGTNIAADIIAIEAQTDDIGTAGAGLTAIPWNAAWDAEVESEVDDALGGGTGTALTAIPWNAAWDAEVQSEAADALNAYDPPTHAELTTAVGSVTVTTNNDKTGYALSSAGIDAILDDTIPEPSGVFAWPVSVRDALGWLGALARNKRTQTTSAQVLRNDADNATLATSSTSDDGTTTTRGEWS